MQATLKSSDRSQGLQTYGTEVVYPMESVPMERQSGGQVMYAATGGGEMDHFFQQQQQSSVWIEEGTLDVSYGGVTFINSTRAQPITVQWLFENFEASDGASLPRYVMYSHYLRHCQQNKLDPLNPASFGKLVRAVFVGLKTRRLGNRGNSKYHYYGMRIKAGSELLKVSDLQIFRYPYFDGPPYKRMKPDFGSYGAYSQLPEAAASYGGAAAPVAGAAPVAAIPDAATAADELYLFIKQEKNFPEFPFLEIGDNTELPSGVTMPLTVQFEEDYQANCWAVWESIKQLQFSQIESLWLNFWQTPANVPAADAAAKSDQPETTGAQSGSASSGSCLGNGVPDADASGDAAAKGGLLYKPLCGMPAVQLFVEQCDFQLYQAVSDMLVPDVLRIVPSQLTQMIRSFAKNVETWMRAALVNFPDDFVAKKINAVTALSQMLRRHTSLNHLAQAARAVLSNDQQITQMVSDFGRIDFAHIQEQANWVCACDPRTVRSLEQQFRQRLSEHCDLAGWTVWLTDVVDTVLRNASQEAMEMAEEATKSVRSTKTDKLLKSGNFVGMDFTEYQLQLLDRGHSFILNWSFFSSLVIRDLTLRSAASFGSFHLIRLLYDEYLFYLVELKLANLLDCQPIEVVSKIRAQARFFRNGLAIRPNDDPN